MRKQNGLGDRARAQRRGANNSRGLSRVLSIFYRVPANCSVLSNFLIIRLNNALFFNVIHEVIFNLELINS